MVDAISSSRGTPARKKNAASQFRSRRKRIQHPLETDDASTSLPSAGYEYEYSTPPRNNMPLPVTPEDDETPKPITPEEKPCPSMEETPSSLLDALTFAARPSPDGISKKSNTKSLEDDATPPPSYISSIEAMAAHVEASHNKNKKQRNTTKPTKSPVKLTPLSSKIIKGDKKQRGGSNNGGNISPLGSRKLYSSNSSVKSSSSSSTRRTSNKKKSRVPPPSTTKPARVWLIALPILVPFLLCETFLVLLVYMFKDSLATGEVIVGSVLPEVNHINLQHVVGTLPVPVIHENDVVGKTKAEADGTTVALDTSSTKHLQSKLEEGFAKMMGIDDELRGVDAKLRGSCRKSVESLCGDVWEVANDMVTSSESNVVDGNVKTVEPIVSKGVTSQSAVDEYNSLALDAQHCLGAAGLAFLEKDDIDSTRLGVSTQVFDRLSVIEPYDADVRAGLGTALLIQGIFHHDEEESRRSLSLATYHLNVASSLCSSSSRLEKVNTDTNSDMAPTSLSSRLTKINDGNAASHAAILHNLALAYMAAGDMHNSVPLLLRSSAIRREHTIHTDTQPYWSVPNDVLMAVEERAVLIAASRSNMPELGSPNNMNKRRRRSRIPFMPFFRDHDFTVEEMIGIE